MMMGFANYIFNKQTDEWNQKMERMRSNRKNILINQKCALEKYVLKLPETVIIPEPEISVGEGRQ